MPALNIEYGDLIFGVKADPRSLAELDRELAKRTSQVVVKFAFDPKSLADMQKQLEATARVGRGTSSAPRAPAVPDADIAKLREFTTQFKNLTLEQTRYNATSTQTASGMRSLLAELDRQRNAVQQSSRAYTQYTSLMNQVAQSLVRFENKTAIRLPTPQENDNRKLREYINSFKELETRYRTTGIDADGTARKMRGVATELEKQRAVLPKTSALYTQYSNLINQSASAADRLEGKVNKLSFANGIQSGLMQRYQGILSSVGPAGGVAAQGLDLVASGAGVVSTGAVLATGAVAGLVAGAVALDRIGADSFKSLQFSVAQLKVNGVADIAALRGEIKDLQQETKTAQTLSEAQLTAAVTNIVRANRSEKEALDILKPSITLAVAEKKDLNEVTLNVSQTLRVFTKDASQATLVVDQFAKAGNLAQKDASNFAEGVATVGNTAANSGYSLAQLLGRLIELDNAGLDPAQEGGRALRTILGTLNKGADTTRESLAKLGISLADDVTGKAKPAGVVLDELVKKLENNTNASQIAFDLFEGFGANALLGLSSNYETLSEQIQAANGYTDTFRETYEKANRELSERALQTALTDLGTAFSLMINEPLVAFLNNVAAGIRAVDEAIKNGGENLPNFIGGKTSDFVKGADGRYYPKGSPALELAPTTDLFPGGLPGSSGVSGGVYTPPDTPPAVAPIVSIASLEQQIKELEEKRKTLAVSTAEFAATTKELEAVQAQLDTILGRNTTGQTRSSKTETLTEAQKAIQALDTATNTYRNTLDQFVTGKSLGIFTDEVAILQGKLSATEGFIDTLLENYQYLDSAQQKQLTDAVARRDAYKEEIKAMQDAQKQQEAYQKFLASRAGVSIARDPNIIYDPLTGQLVNLAENRRAVTQAGLERDIARREEAEALERARQERVNISRDSNVIYDPLTGQLINLADNKRAIAQSQTERNVARRQELESLERSRQERLALGSSRNASLTYDPISGQVIDLAANKRAVSRVIAENEIARRQEAQALETARVARLAVSREAGLIYDPISGQMINLVDNKRAIDQLQAERSAARREEQRQARDDIKARQVSQTPSPFARTYDPTTGGVFVNQDFQRDLQKARAGTSTNVTLDNLQKSFAFIDAQSRVLGTSFDTTGAKISATETAIKELLANGMDPQSEIIQRLIGDYNILNAKQSELQKVNGYLTTAINILNNFKGLQAGLSGDKGVSAGQFFSSAGGVAAGIATLIPGGAAVAPLIQAGASLFGGLLDSLESIFNPNGKAIQTMTEAVENSFRSGIQGALERYRKGELDKSGFADAIKSSLYDSVFSSVSGAFLDAALQTAGITPLIAEIADAALSGSESRLNAALAKLDAFLASPAFDSLVNAGVQIADRFRIYTGKDDELKTDSISLVAPVTSIDTGPGWVPEFIGLLREMRDGLGDIAKSNARIADTLASPTSSANLSRNSRARGAT
jgi:TP901 family phage tail tape measure protein